MSLITCAAVAGAVAVDWVASGRGSSLPGLAGWLGTGNFAAAFFVGLLTGLFIGLIVESTHRAPTEVLQALVRSWQVKVRGSTRIGLRAVFEEAVWRGILLVLVGTVVHWSLAVAVTAVVFGVWHVTRGVRHIFVTTLLGLAFGALFIVGGLLCAAVAHYAYNYTLARSYAGRMVQRLS